MHSNSTTLTHVQKRFMIVKLPVPVPYLPAYPTLPYSYYVGAWFDKYPVPGLYT